MELRSHAGGAPLIAEVPREVLSAEIATLRNGEQLLCNSSLYVYCARAAQIPRVLNEIGRLRELTFREAGEGTGKSCDLDAFDAYYRQLFLWDALTQRVVGAYRLGLADEIVASHGKNGLYTNSLFSYPTRLLRRLQPAIELGRSFVRAEYQRDFAPLLLLWRGIARFVQGAPQYAVLFGAVSISASYAPASRRLMMDYLATHCIERSLASQVKPRRPYANAEPTSAGDRTPRSLDELARLVSSIEQDGKGVPVLLRQYLRLGGRLLAFGLDRQFMNVLDGLIMVDLRQIEPAVLARYMGKSGSAAFLAYHSPDYAAAAG
jgi:putative hemolysin